MMLHGDIKVNGDIIAYWQATRIDDPPEVVNHYTVFVAYREPDGTHHTVTGEVSHRFGDGALMLTSEVMVWATHELAHLFPHTPNKEGAISNG